MSETNTNKEFKPQNTFSGSFNGGKPEFFNFLFELEGEWKIVVKPLKGGVCQTVRSCPMENQQTYPITL